MTVERPVHRRPLAAAATHPVTHRSSPSNRTGARLRPRRLCRRTLQDATRIPYAEIPEFPAEHRGRSCRRAGYRDGRRRRCRRHAGPGASLRGIFGATGCVSSAGVCRMGVKAVVLDERRRRYQSGLRPRSAGRHSRPHQSAGAEPTVGPNDDRFGPRFPDMTDCYDPQFASLCRRRSRARWHRTV